MASISIVVPVLNEEAEIERVLPHLIAERPYELIVADGGSTDRTVEIARRLATVVQSEPGRGIQLNAGARAATGDLLLFVHADCRFAPGGLDAIRAATSDSRVVGGSFDLRFDGNCRSSAVFTRINRVRRRCGVVYGDAGIFCRRTVFQALGGFRNWPILEDYELARRLGQCGRMAHLEHPIWASDRRWRNAGLMRTMASWFFIQGLYMAGVSPRRLARLYGHIR